MPEITTGSHRATALDDPHHDNDESDDQQYVNEASERVSADQPQQPQDDQDDRDCFQHGVSFPLQVCLHVSGDVSGEARTTSLVGVTIWWLLFSTWTGFSTSSSTSKRGCRAGSGRPSAARFSSSG